MSGATESVPWDALSVGATRPAVIKGFNVPFWFILPIIGCPTVIVSLTQNPFWLLLIVPLTAIGRWIVARDHNRPRVLFLALISGAMFADRWEWGGYSSDPLGDTPRYIRAAGREMRRRSRAHVR